MKPYYEGNYKGFEADIHLAEKVKSIIDEKKITWVCETGSYFGNTTKRFAEWVDRVDTIEIDPKHFDIAGKNLSGFKNIWIYLGSSPEVMPGLISNNIDSKGLFYLDAHFGGCALLDELKVIANSNYKPECVIVHDFVVPGHPELGYDEYNGQKLEWEWIKPSIEKIYGVDGYQIEYNSEATGAKRGVIFIKPKE
jgi:hypothetical protein